MFSFYTINKVLLGFTVLCGFFQPTSEMWSFFLYRHFYHVEYVFIYKDSFVVNCFRARPCTVILSRFIPSLHWA